jgi:succinoglycan biosynthesis transport protein ExoP
MIGLFTVVAYESSKPGVHSRRDAERATPGVSVLATIPRIQVARPNSHPPSRPVRVGNLLLRGRVPPAEDALVARSDPWHPASEAYRALAANLIGARPSAPQLLVVTSALPGEGKTTLAANLAITLARSGTRTLLLDGDLRTGNLATLLGVRDGPGWPSLTRAGSALEDAVRPLSVGDGRAPLDLLPAGSPDMHPSEVLASAGLPDLLKRLRQRYEAIIVDTPPLQAAFDATALGALADGTLLVVRSGATGRDALENAADELHRARVGITGIVLNYSESPANRAYASRNGQKRREG